MQRRLVGAAFAVGVAAALGMARVQPATKIPTLLDAYLAGSHDEALAGLRSHPDVPAGVVELVRDGTGWILSAGTPEEVRRRRLAAASLALEFSVARMVDEWRTLRPLIEWGCAQVRQGPPSPAELAWHRAALAVIQGARDNALARSAALAIERPKPRSKADPVPLCALRFPTDSVVRFAQGFHQEFSVPVEGTMGAITDTAATRAGRAIDFYGKAAEDPELAHESSLAIGYIHLRMQRREEALTALASAAGSADPFVRYLAHLFRGRTLQQLGRPGDAGDAFRAALDVIPRAQSASIALAALTHLGDRPDDAIGLLSTSFAARPAEDPWREYGFGQFRHWPRYRDRLREALR